MRWFVCICISLLIASTASARDKNRWRGLFVGQGRAEAHEVIYGLSEYHSPWGESAFFCADDRQAWESDDRNAWQIKRIKARNPDLPATPPYQCFANDDHWSIWIKTDNWILNKIDVDVWFEDDVVVRIGVHRYFYTAL